MNTSHRLRREPYERLLVSVFRLQTYAQLQLLAPVNHVRKHLVNGVVVHAGPFGDFEAEFAAAAA
jgi:hypothetical protein